MPRNDDDILAQELGKVGARSGSAGGVLGSIIGARLLPTKEFEITATIRASAAVVTRTFTSILANEGTVLGSEGASGSVVVSGLVNSGFLNMNPAILIAQIQATGPDTTSLRITGKAKEGLINQHTAEKASQRVVEALFSSLR